MPSLHESSDPNRTFSAVDTMSQEALSHYYNSLRSESGYGSESYASEQEEEPEEEQEKWGEDQEKQQETPPKLAHPCVAEPGLLLAALQNPM